MNTDKVLHLPGIRMPELTPQRIQELKLTQKGRQILAKDVSSFPVMLKTMENRLQELLASYEQHKLAGKDSLLRRQLLGEMLEEQLYWEFAYHIMFVKWREGEKRKAS
jgi:hypothetical protein